MTYEEMLEILRGKVLYESAEETQQRLNEIADAMWKLICERDVAIDDLREMNCETCDHRFVIVTDEPCQSCKDGLGYKDNWEWRGVQE